MPALSIRFPADLPISDRSREIIDAIRRHPVVIVAGETGSGKTTQIPKCCIRAGRGRRGRIGCTQPRRIAAVSVANRLAEETGVKTGEAVGYRIRFADRTSDQTVIKIMTDGVLLSEAQSDRHLRQYDTLIVDEAHERSLNIDFVLGILKGLLKRRRDLKVIITSATIDTKKFSRAFDDAPVIEVSGRTYPVEVRYRPPETAESEDTLAEAAVHCLDSLVRESRRGDILVFMPTEQDIRETCDLAESRDYRDTRVLPLFARLPAAEQVRVFRPFGGRKIIVATNVAETSITIPGIRYVVDTGLARISRYSPRTRTTSLPVAPVSRSSADQRAGRCGRVAEGICVRLYAEEDYRNRPLYTAPEILRANLAEVILRMISLRLGDIERFPFIDPPAPASIRDGFRLLTELGAIAAGGSRQPSARLTPKGQMMARLPIDPRLACMLLTAGEEGCLEEMLVIVSALSIQPPFERPRERQAEADRAHRQFADPLSDFATLLNVWRGLHETTGKKIGAGQLKKYCLRHFLSFRRMREWQDIHRQVAAITREHRVGRRFKKRAALPGKGAVEASRLRAKRGQPEDYPERYAAVHRAVLSGLLSNIARQKEKNLYRAARGREVMLFPGSGLFNRGGEWVVAAEVVETSRTFARIVARIDHRWIEPLAGDLCRYHYRDPHWERKRGEVVATEQVTLFGLVISDDSSVSYGRIDPEEATRIFIQSALVEGDLRKPFGFIGHNRKLIGTIQAIEDRLRRRDILVSPDEMVDLYQKRLGECYSVRTLAARIRKTGGDGFLRFTREEIQNYQPGRGEMGLYPGQVTDGTRRFDCVYDFNPGQQTDGLTIRIPAGEASAVAPDFTDWLVPGLFPDKIAALLKGLPKTYRRKLVPINDTVDIIVTEMPRGKGALVSQLGAFVYRRFGVDIPASAWPMEELPDHLRARIAVTGNDGREIRSGRDKAVLLAASETGPQETAGVKELRRRWERDDVTSWDFPALPDQLPVPGRETPVETLYPALEAQPDGKTIRLKLFTEKTKAQEVHPGGVALLLQAHLGKEMRFLRKALALDGKTAPWVQQFGGARAISERLVGEVCRRLLRQDFRSREAFERYAGEMSSRLIPEGNALLAGIVPAAQACHETGTAIAALERSVAGNPSSLAHLERLRHEMANLMPPSFVSLYSPHRLKRMVDYLRVIAIRARKGIEDPAKYARNASRLEPFETALKGFVEGLSPHTSAEKKEAIEAFFWMIEEFKISVFAQQIRTDGPVSAKRLGKRAQAIERMI
jgi:ATP-dependent helicase HrpA